MFYKLKSVLEKYLNKEIIMYVIFGVVTTISNISIYSTLLVINVEYKSANFIAIIISIIIAYVLNKKFVFCSKCSDLKELLKEIYLFMSARAITFLIDYFGLIFMIEILNTPNIISKYFITILVIILNYILSKKLVFKKKEGEKMLPNDPNMLVSFVNMKLRDFYPSLDAMCDDLDVSRDEIETKLKVADYTYNSELNKFV